MKLKAILFDMDDTLIDWGGRVHDWATHERQHLGYVLDHVTAQGHAIADVEAFYHAVRTITTQAWVASDESLRAPNYVEAIEQGLARVGVPTGSFDHDALLEMYGWGLVEGVTVFPDAQEVLPVLRERGLTLGLITNAATPMRFRDRELAMVGLLDYFSDCRLSAVDVGYIKPHPAIFHHALDMLELTPAEVVFVGDNPEADVVGAQQVGMKAVLRNIKREGLVYRQGITPDAAIDTLHDMLPILDTWYPGWR